MSLIPVPNRYASKPIRAVFVITTGRAGSMWLAWALQQLYHSTVSLHEAGYMLKGVGFDYYHNRVPHSSVVETIRAVKLPAVEAARLYMKKTHYIEVNRDLFSLADPIMEALRTQYSIPKIIGLVGDARTYVRSMANKGAYVQSRKYGWFVPRYAPDWESLSQVEKLSYSWVHKTREILNARCRVFKIESLTRSMAEFNTLARTIDLPTLRTGAIPNYNRITKSRLNHVPCNLYNTFYDISPQDREAFWRITGSTMAVLGYPQSDPHERSTPPTQTGSVSVSLSQTGPDLPKQPTGV
jgi:hypothetical protein